jgi:hypothetical protein
MANVRKRILELTALESASLNTTIVGVDGGITYKIELDTLADAVTSRVNILDRDRLASLESVTSSFETKGRSVVSSSTQITAFGFISSSTAIPIGTISSSTQISDFGFISSSHTDITSLNSFTSSQSSLNTAFTNGITARLQTSSFNEYTASQSTSSLVNRLNAIESISGSWITESETGSFLTSLSGAISSSTQISDLGFVTGSYTTINSFNSLTQSFNSISQSFNVISGSVVSIQGGFDTGSYQTFTSSVNASISNLNTFTASVTTASIVTSINNLNTFTASVSTASLVTSISNLNSFTSSQSTSSLVNRLNTIESVSGSWITESETGSFLTSLSGAISSSSQLTSSFDTRYLNTGGDGVISGSAQLPSGLISGSTQLTTAFPSKTTGAWSVPAGASTQSFTVEAGASYTMWVNGNIPNGIITWNATVTTSNTNVPVVGSQYGWYYTAGNALVLTAMPDQIIGTTNTLISSPASYAPNTSNVFKFGITNNSGTTQTINYGYIKLS